MLEIVCENRECEKRKITHKFGGAKVCKTEQVTKYFVNPKAENEVFGLYVSYIICSLGFRNTEAVIRRCTSDSNIGVFLWNFRNLKEHLFLQSTSGGCFWKYLTTPLFISFENDEWCHFVVRISSPVLVSFYWVCFVSFYFFLFFLFFVVNSTSFWFYGKFVNT